MSGLEGVVMADTELSSVDGLAGELLLRGVPVQEAAERPFEAVFALLHHGDSSGSDEVQAALGASRAQAWSLRARWSVALDLGDPMDALRSGLAALDGDDAPLLVGAAAVLVAAWSRARRGLDPLPPDPALPHAADLLRMHGTPPTPARERALNAYLASVVDHGFNASTFTARVVASTRSDLVSCVVAAVGALKGPLHGGAPGPVLDMLDAVGTPESAAQWVADELAAGRRIMGIGHRVYRVRDPRAAVLEEALDALDAAEPNPTRAARIALARAVEHAAIDALHARYPDRPMYANVEFATALLLEALGIGRALFPAVFACSRVAGWTAHVAEQRSNGRLIRPEARYVGPRPAA